MKIDFRKLVAVLLTAVMLVSMMSVLIYANETVWNGDGLSVDVKPGHDGYTFLSVYRKPGHAYEMSNHMVSLNGGVNNDIPQTLVLVDASKEYTWTPDGKYVHGESNYEVLYCCDAKTGYNDGVYYKRLNLEDSEYYDEEEAAHIRAIVTHSYPYITIDQMKADLKAAGLEFADELTRAEIISAVQAAIWAYANVDMGEYKYSQTFDIPTNTQWGTVMHDYTNEMDVWWNAGKRVFSKSETTENHINLLTEYLKGLDKVAPAPEGIIISDLEIVKTVPTVGKDGTFSTTLRVALNNSGSSDADSLKLDVFVDGVPVRSLDVEFGTCDYVLTVEAKVGQKITAIVSGTQVLPVGAYFYAPEPADVDNDGIATSREVSQNLVGVASGETPVFASEEVYVPGETELTVTKSWIDDDNRDGIRPENITVRLHADGNEIISSVLSEENDWKCTIEKLPIYSESGALIDYTVTEDTVAGYDALIDGLEITNSHESERTSVNVTKMWEDDDDRDGIRPKNVTVRLYADGIEIDSAVLNAENGWHHSFEGLYKFEDGKEIVYTVTEDAVENYVPEITETDDGFVIYNSYKPLVTFVNVNKVWNDENDRYGIRPDSISVVLYADGKPTDNILVLNEENGFSGVFADLPVNFAGEKIVYTVEELVVDGYESSVTGNATEGFVIINTLDREEEIIEDPEIPLGPSDDDNVDIDDPEVPLGPSDDVNAPQTGDGIVLLVITVLSSAVCAVIILRSKKYIYNR